MNTERLYRLCTAGALAVLLFASADVMAADTASPIDTLYAVHYAPEPRGDAGKEAEQLLKTKFPRLKRRARRDEKADGTTVYFEVMDMKKEGIDPPSPESLKYFGHGITAAQVQAMQKSTVTVAVFFTYPMADAVAAEIQANAFMKELAERTGGFVWDVETRELFSPELLTQVRLAPLDHGFPDVSRHITIHAYQDDEYVRAITLGMRKFGLPDLVVNEFRWSLQNQMGGTINLFAQSLLEGARPKLGAWDFDPAKMRHAGVLTEYEGDRLEKTPPAVAQLTLAEGKADQGDPENALLELRFDRYAGKTVHEKHQAFISSFYGAEDSVIQVKHNEAIRAASERARKQLPALRQAFNAGLEPGERIMLKVPFRIPDGGNEYMWVEVSTWKGADIRGLLANEPDFLPDLHAGAAVQIKEQEVFDYIRYKADGRVEGNETSREIEKLQSGR